MALMKGSLVLLVILATTLPCMTGYKILGVFPHAGKSHFDVFVPLMRELAKRGHDITVISHFPETNPHPNYKDISLKGSEEILLNVLDVNLIKHHPLHEFGSVFMLAEFGTKNCESLGLPQIQNLIKSKETFDLIIQEQFNSDCYLGLVHMLKAPHIGLSSCTMMSWNHDRMGLPVNPAYIPMNLFKLSDHMTFFERVKNTLGLAVINYVLQPILMDWPCNAIAKKHLGDDLPNLSEIAKNTTLTLVNTHYSVNRPRPLPPNVIEVSGLHIGESKNLPKDIENFLNESEHGVIYFSFGSLVRGASFPEHVRRAFLDAFAELPQRVLWKYENDTLPGKPSNVMIRKWMPQFDILGHPNVLAFITHGGLLGTTEGIYRGVPLIMIPLFGDQFTNAMTVERSGGSVVLEFEQLTKSVILEAIHKVLQPSFQEKAKTLSRLYNDRPESAMNTAVWWVEYVARHGHGRMLHSQIIDMPFYQTLLLDVVAFVIVVSALTVLVLYKLCTWGCSRSRSAKVKTN